jgi:hypothetical protein
MNDTAIFISISMPLISKAFKMKIKIYTVGGTIDKIYFDPDKIRKNLDCNWFEDLEE